MDSRSTVNGVYRRRKCNKCSFRFSTIEVDRAVLDELRDFYFKLKPAMEGIFERCSDVKKTRNFVKQADDGEELGGVHIDEEEIRRALM